MLPIIEKVASEIDTNDLDLACLNEHKSFHHIKYITDCILERPILTHEY